jgi:Tol biopolymer transport system component
MGEVYRARDERLDRDVAVKILPREFAEHPDRVARFQREARTLAALSHPNIATIHGIEQVEGSIALVMEFVDGQDLSAQLARGPLPLDAALRIADQIADALEAAHQQGIVHRDLKPANITVRGDGAVKVLDFGLAKVREVSGATERVDQAPTITSADLTREGMIIGTPAYMSPEQTRGQGVDARTDIWAFGCVLFEMLTGRRPFGGSHQSDIVAAILKLEPDWTALPPETPASIRRLLARCLRKEPRDRLRDIGDARLEIGDAGKEERAARPAGAAVRSSRIALRAGWVVAAAALVGLAASALRPRSAPPEETRLHLVTPPSPVPSAVAISPDGRALVYLASEAGESRLWLRPLNTETARELQGTEGADSPFWSPDSRSIGFLADGRLKRIDVDSGSVRTLANLPTATEGTWGRNGVILAASRGRQISRIPADGGEAVDVRGARAGSNFSPTFLPDGRRFLYYHRGSPETRGIYVGDLEGPAMPNRLVDSQSGAVYTSGHLLFVLAGTLFAQPFDPATLALSGQPRAIARQVPSSLGQASLSVSTQGTIAYRGASAPVRRQLVWFDRTGAELRQLGDPGEIFAAPSLSRNGESLVFYRGLSGNIDIWTMDVVRGALGRVTTHPSDDVMPVWSPDGRRIAFSSLRSGVLELYTHAVGESAEEPLAGTQDTGMKIPTDWSADGAFLLYTAEGPGRSLDLWALPLAGDRTPIPVATHSDAFEQSGQFSPDGRWIAYQSDESGRAEIHLQPFRAPGDKVVVSTGGGTQVRWRRDGGELFYIARSGDLMAVSVEGPAQGGTPRLGAARRLFTPSIDGASQRGARHQYDVTPDGRRILVVTMLAQPQAPLSLILNWNPGR